LRKLFIARNDTRLITRGFGFKMTYPVGYTILQTEDTVRKRPLILDIWYPAETPAPETPHNYGLGTGTVAENAPVIKTLCPVIVMSHGAFGSARNYSWVAEHMARHGFLVLGVSHVKESPVYGPETIDPASALQPWHRPQDCSSALTYLLSESTFQDIADPSRIGALGHSSGGATAIAMGGAVFNPDAMAQYCQARQDQRDKGCGYASGAPHVSVTDPDARKSWRDDRIRAILALDPALGPGYDAQSLSRMSVRVHIIGAEENDFLPFESHAGHYAALIPGATLTRLSGGEGHFIFIDVCQADIQVNKVSLCKDRPGVRRAEVHEMLTGIIREFFEKNLTVAVPDERIQ
jgi:predicted dienelactone hydrolase